MLRHGLGRAVLFLRNAPDATPYREIVRRACREDWRYDHQTEDRRAPYLFDVIHATGEPTYYAGGVADALRTIRTPDVAQGTHRFQLFSLAARLTSSGDGDLRDAMYAALERLADEPDELTDVGEAVIELDGITGYRYLAGLLARNPPRDEDDRWREVWLLEDLIKRFGEDEVSDRLRAALLEPATAAYVADVARRLADSNREIKERPAFAPPPPPTDAEIAAYLDSTNNTKPRTRFASRETMRRLAGEFAVKADRGRQSRYVQLFLRIKREFGISAVLQL